MSRSGRGTSRGVNKIKGMIFRSQTGVNEALRLNLNRKTRARIAQMARERGFKAKVR